MTTPAQQAALLAAYSEALGRDPAASPPSGLDPALAGVEHRLQQALRPAEPDLAFVAALRERLREPGARVALNRSPALTASHWRWRRTFPSRRWSLVLLAAMIALVLAGTAVASGSLLRLQRPEQRPIGGSTVMAFAGALPWILCQPAAFQPLDPSDVAPRTGRPIAYLPDQPAGLNAPAQVSLIGTPGQWPQPAAIAWGPRAVVRYQGGGHTLIVELDEPSPGMALQKILVGQRTVQLPDGRRAFASTFPEWPVPNTVAFAADRYIITLASDLPGATVEQLAAGVLVVPAAVPPAGGATTVAPVHVGPIAATAPAAPVVTGTVRHRQDWWPGGHMHVLYDVRIASMACARPAQQVQATVEFPPVLAAHAIDPNPPMTFSTLGSAGFGGDVAFDVSGLDPAIVQASLTQGITIRVSWVEDGRRKERAFPIR